MIVPDNGMRGRAVRRVVRPAVLVTLCCAVPVLVATPALSVTASLTLTQIASPSPAGNPVFAISPPGDAARMFVGDQHSGKVRIYNIASNTFEATPFLTVPNLGSGAEQGLVGFAFAPDYASSGKVYVSTINAAGDNQVIEYGVSGNPNIADPASARQIITIDHPDDGSLVHYSGWIGFGPKDGNLYVGVGDSGQGTSSTVAQDPSSLLGSMLRIDLSKDEFPADSDRNYAIPVDNPFAAGGGAPEVFAKGFRNPWRPSFDAKTGALLIADVGEDSREEISLGALGGNFGWPAYEGSLELNAAMLSDTLGPVIGPQYEYLHDASPLGGFSITGGGVYDGPVNALDNLYFFGDFVTGKIWSLHWDGVTLSDIIVWTLAYEPGNIGTLNLLASFGVDGVGNLYALDWQDGQMFRVSATSLVVTPLPPAFTLFGSAILLGALLRRKKRHMHPGT